MNSKFLELALAALVVLCCFFVASSSSIRSSIYVGKERQEKPESQGHEVGGNSSQIYPVVLFVFRLVLVSFYDTLETYDNFILFI